MRSAFCNQRFYPRGAGRAGLLFRSLLRTMAWTVLQTGVAPVSLTSAQEKGDPLRAAQSDALTQETKGGARGPSKCHAEAIGRERIGQAPSTGGRLRESSGHRQ